MRAVPLQRLAREAAWGLLIGVLGAAAAALPAVAGLAGQLELGVLFHLRGAQAPPPSVAVVAIDESSARNLALPADPTAWPRDEHARLIDRLARAGARAILFDVTFENPGRSAQADEALAASMRRAGNVVLTDALRRETGAQAGRWEIERTLPPIPLLERAALAHAPFPLPRGARVDAWWTFKAEAGDRATLPVIALQIRDFDGYRPLIEALREAAPALRLVPPRSVADLLSGARAGALDDALRAAFAADPTLAGRVAGALRRDATRRQALALLNVYSGGESAWLDYRGPPRTIETLSYDRALGPEGARLAGKVVFVGFSAQTQAAQDLTRDDYQTVFSEADGLYLSGVEIAATAFADLDEGRSLRALPAPALLALLLAWGTALGIACRLLRPGAALALAAALSAAYLGLAVQRFAAASLWLPLLVPLGVQAPVAALRGVWLNYIDARRERERIRQLAGRYLPADAVARLIDRLGPAASAERIVHGVCLSTDLANYTALAERMSPPDLLHLMNEYFARLFKPVEQHGGTVCNLAGDAMLAVWPAPASGSKDPAGRRACLAALQIDAAARRFGRGAGRPPMRTRIGLHSGHLALGSVGAAGYMQYDAMGDIVNTATRIQALGKVLGVNLLASRDAVEGVSELAIRPLGRFLLAGKSTAVDVVQILGLSADQPQSQADRCARFAEALQDYEAGRLDVAARRFGELALGHADDGPLAFFLRCCETARATGRDPSPIVIETK